MIDQTARIVDPIISGFNTGEHVWGRFLKDYSRRIGDSGTGFLKRLWPTASTDVLERRTVA